MPRHPAQAFRFPPETTAKIEELAAAGYMDKTAVLTKAIDRLYEAETRTRRAPVRAKKVDRENR